MLGADALVEDEGTYRPDFSAHAGSERLRCVRISKASFDTITSMSRQEGQTPPHHLKIEADGEHAAVAAADANGVDGMTAAASGNGGSARKSSSKQRAFSDEGTRHSITSTASSSGGGGGSGAGGTRIALPSPPKKRGVPSGASLKILQAATGVAVIPAAASSPAASPRTQDTQPDKPPSLGTPQSRSAELEAGAGVETCASGGEEAGISLVTTTTATTANTSAGEVPPASSRVAGSEGDVESGSGPPQQREDDGAGSVAAEMPKIARI